MSVTVQRDGGNKPGQDIEVFLKNDLSQLERGRQAINENYLNMYNLSCRFVEPVIVGIGEMVAVTGVVGEAIAMSFGLSVSNDGKMSSTYETKLEVPLP